MATQALFRYYRGVTNVTLFHYITSAGADINLTGTPLTFRISRPPEADYVLVSGDPPNAQGSQLVITNAVQGKFTLTITDEDTALFEFNLGGWWLGLNNGGAISRIAFGKVIVANPPMP